MTEDELQRLLENNLPPADLHGAFVEDCQDQDVRLRFFLRPGEQWSSAALLGVVDTALRAATGVASTLANLAVTVLKAADQSDVIALSRVIRRDGAVAHAEAWLFSHAAVDPMLHATASFRTPPPA